MRKLIVFIMFFTLAAQVTIGNVRFDHISKSEIKQSVSEQSNTAYVIVPKNYNLEGKNVLDYIKVGDVAEIKLGYNGELYTEFAGYVTKIGSDIPIRIEFEDEMYKLRKTSFNRSWKEVSLKQLLEYVIKDSDISCPEVNLGKFTIKNSSAYRVLAELKDKYGLYSYFKEDILHCSFIYDIRNSNKYNHTYDFLKNVRKNGNKLKYRRVDDYEIRIKAISTLPSGEKIKYEHGSDSEDASVRTLNFRNKTETELKELSEKEYSRLNFDGYEGSITGFGIPRTNAGDSLTIKSDDEDKDGTYFIDSVIVVFDNSFLSRENKISAKV